MPDFSALNSKPFREAHFWARLRRVWPVEVMVRRIEDASGNAGTFDTFLASRDVGFMFEASGLRFPSQSTGDILPPTRGLSAWMELKVAGPGAKPTLRPGQDTFAGMLMDAGVPCGYLVGSKCGALRLIGGRTTGADWREHVLGQWQATGRLELRQAIVTLLAHG